MLTEDHMAFFLMPLPPNEVMFLQGNAYAQEWAIASRIEQVDPAWSFAITDIHCRDKRTVATGTLTILDSTRGNVGMNQITYRKDAQDNPHAEANDAEKSAATDCFKRCARLFGIGRYFLTLPNWVKDNASYGKWYRQQQGDGDPTPQNGNVPGTHAGVKLDENGLAKGYLTKHVKRVDDQGTRHSFMVDPLGKVIVWGNTDCRKTFINTGWIDENEWDDVDVVEELNPPIPALFAPSGDKWWDLHTVLPHPELERS